MAGRMAQGYYAHKAAIEIAADARSDKLEILDEPRIGHAVPVGDVIREDGTGHAYDIRHYLNHARTNRDMVEDLKRVWLIGSLIGIGDALSDLHYLNDAPFLELIFITSGTGLPTATRSTSRLASGNPVCVGSQVIQQIMDRRT